MASFPWLLVHYNHKRIKNAISLSFGLMNLLVSKSYDTFAATTCIMVGIIFNLDGFIPNINKNWWHLPSFCFPSAAKIIVVWCCLNKKASCGWKREDLGDNYIWISTSNLPLPVWSQACYYRLCGRFLVCRVPEP